MTTPEARARQNIDAQLIACGWVVQDHAAMNLYAGRGVAVREFPLQTGYADYLLFIDRKAAGVLEAKAEGILLAGVAEQAGGYAVGLPANIPHVELPLPLLYESIGVETFLRDNRDPEPRSHRLFAFHRPETLSEWIEDPGRGAPRAPAWHAPVEATDSMPGPRWIPSAPTLRGRLCLMPEAHPLITDHLWHAQVEAIHNLKASFAADLPENLISLFRTSYNLRLAVTVDMIATDTDIKPLEALLFMRAVRSRVLFEQELIDTGTVERKRSVPLKSLLEAVAVGAVDDDLLGSLARRLALQDAIDPDQIYATALAGTGAWHAPDEVPDDANLAAARSQLIAHAITPLAASADLRGFLLEREILIDDPSVDEVTERGFDADATVRARQLVDSFQQFIQDNRDEFTALQILYSRPYAQRHLEFAQVRELAKRLNAALVMGEALLMTEALWRAYALGVVLDFQEVNLEA